MIEFIEVLKTDVFLQVLIGLVLVAFIAKPSMFWVCALLFYALWVLGYGA